jgi:small subunit ribosomal protein S17
MDEKKAAKPAEGDEKTAVKKAVRGVKEAAKAVVAAVTHPVETAKHPAATLKGAADAVIRAVIGQEATTAGRTAKQTRGQPRAMVGIVKSDKMDKTVVVEVISLKRDPVYGKYLKSRMRYKAHDAKNEFHTGDRVEIREHRPLSRHKRWAVSKLIDRAKVE